MMLLVCAILGLWGVAKAEVDTARVSCCDCNTMYPHNVPDGVDPQVMRYPFRIQVEQVDYVGYKPFQRLNVNLTSLDPSRHFRLFMIQARSLAGDRQKTDPVGGFVVVKPAINVHPTCNTGQFGTALAATDRTPKNHVELEWTAPNTRADNVEFRATFVEDDNTFWVRERSEPVHGRDGGPLPNTGPAPVVHPFDTTSCGSSKGCYRYPADCVESQCEYIVTWHSVSDNNVHNIRFELGAYVGFSDRYVALALSEDKRMGNDIVMECVHNSNVIGNVTVYHSYNEGKSNRRRSRDSRLYQKGSYNNGRLRCVFDRPVMVYDVTMGDFPLTKNPWHLLVARGSAHEGKIYRHGLQVGALPVVSPYAVDIQGTANIGGKASYPLVKAHACLMILAWIFCATIGLLLTKYYKPMWPNQRFLGERYWFVGHFNFMAWMVILVVIGFILIFIEAGGYSQVPDLPGRAHPILGIIIFCCILINPIIALIRPAEDNKCRPVFNWFHCIFGTIANVLAIPNIFIGMDFGKASVPWWSTWILVIYIIFHIIVEITLEVHQCFTHKKNKERRERYEVQKRENLKAHHQVLEPEPVGHRFKSTMLMVHFVVTCIVTLIMIIIIAVS